MTGCGRTQSVTTNRLVSRDRHKRSIQPEFVVVGSISRALGPAFYRYHSVLTHSQICLRPETKGGTVPMPQLDVGSQTIGSAIVEIERLAEAKAKVFAADGERLSCIFHRGLEHLDVGYAILVVGISNRLESKRAIEILKMGLCTNADALALKV